MNILNIELGSFTQTTYDTIIGTIIGGIGLTIFFFLFREFITPTPNLSGQWRLETRTIKTSYNPYVGLIVKFDLILVQSGEIVRGTGEKMEEISSGLPPKQYIGTNRVRFEIEGSVSKNYFRRSTAIFHVIENGTQRQTSGLHLLKIYPCKKKMIGTFYTTAADSVGLSTFDQII